MHSSEFWELIAQSRSIGRCDERAGVLRRTLRSRGAADIVAFGAFFDGALDALFTWDLWAVAYLIQGGCSDDGFEYFRCWVISQGKENFDLAVSDPVLFGMTIELGTDPENRECEPFLNLAGGVYEELTGEHSPARSQPRPVEPTGDAWDVDGLEHTYPELFARWS